MAVIESLSALEQSRPITADDMRAELEGKLQEDGTYHVTPELMETIIVLLSSRK